jgi:phytoene synthase
MTELSEAPHEQRQAARVAGAPRSGPGPGQPGIPPAAPGTAPGLATLTAAYERCRQLNRRHGTSYYLATRLLPDWKRPHVHALYGFARYADEIVDDLGNGLSPAQRALALADWGERFFGYLRAGRCDDPVLAAVVHTVRSFGIDEADFRAFLTSMAMDLTVTSYASYDHLLGYMEGSAAAIGTMMLPVLESADPAGAREPARQLGLAFQLTNFVRDVGEDLRRRRAAIFARHLTAAAGAARHERQVDVRLPGS